MLVNRRLHIAKRLHNQLREKKYSRSSLEDVVNSGTSSSRFRQLLAKATFSKTRSPAVRSHDSSSSRLARESGTPCVEVFSPVTSLSISRPALCSVPITK